VKSLYTPAHLPVTPQAELGVQFARPGLTVPSSDTTRMLKLSELERRLVARSSGQPLSAVPTSILRIKSVALAGRSAREGTVHADLALGPTRYAVDGPVPADPGELDPDEDDKRGEQAFRGIVQTNHLFMYRDVPYAHVTWGKPQREHVGTGCTVYKFDVPASKTLASARKQLSQDSEHVVGRACVQIVRADRLYAYVHFGVVRGTTLLNKFYIPPPRSQSAIRTRSSPRNPAGGGPGGTGPMPDSSTAPAPTRPPQPPSRNIGPTLAPSEVSSSSSASSSLPTKPPKKRPPLSKQEVTVAAGDHRQRPTSLAPALAVVGGGAAAPPETATKAADKPVGMSGAKRDRSSRQKREPGEVKAKVASLAKKFQPHHSARVSAPHHLSSRPGQPVIIQTYPKRRGAPVPVTSTPPTTNHSSAAKRRSFNRCHLPCPRISPVAASDFCT